MATNTINQNVNTAITDFGLIKQAIVAKGVSVPTGTPTSQYGNKIANIQTGADVSNVTATAADVDTGKVFVDSTGTEVTGQSTYKADYTTLNTLVGQTTAVAEDVAQGKVFVNSSGVQTTGTASGGGSDEDFIEMIERINRTPNTYVSITIPNTTEKIGKGAFYDFGALETINMPNSITLIDENAFFQCSNLKYITWSNTLEELKQNAFYQCKKITTLTLPASIVYIRNAVFYKCTSLTTVTFLGTTNSIASDVFSGCTNLTTINVPWSSGAVSGAPWGATNATIVYDYVPTP